MVHAAYVISRRRWRELTCTWAGLGWSVQSLLPEIPSRYNARAFTLSCPQFSGRIILVCLSDSAASFHGKVDGSFLTNFPKTGRGHS